MPDGRYRPAPGGLRHALPLLALAAGAAPLASPALAQPAAPAAAAAGRSPEELLRRMEQMERRMRMLERRLQEAERRNARAAPEARAAHARPHAPERPGSAAPPTVAAAPPPSAPPASRSPATAPQPAPLAGVAQAAPVGPPGSAPPVAPPPATGAAAEANLPSPPAPGDRAIFGIMESPLEGLRLGAYGEMFFGGKQNPADRGRWQAGFDARRVVLLPSYQFNDDIVLNAEIEFEHGGIGFDADDKLHGTVEVEQLYVDFRLADWLRWRAPGVDLIPIGYINQHHEPTLFYSVFRPELANSIIPTTWSAPSSSLYGRLAPGLGWQVMVSSSLEDFGDDFSRRTEGNRVPPFPQGYAAGINGLDGLNFARAPIGDFRQLSSTVAYSARLDYAPPFVPGLAGSASLYYTPSTTPRGAYADVTGARLGASSLTLADLEFRYRVPDSGFEFRGEYAQAFFGDPRNLRANNDGDPTNNVGRTMYGFSGEAAYHFTFPGLGGRPWEAVPFYRYTYEVLQSGGFRGTDENLPTGAGQLQFHTVGVAVFPTRQLVLKLNYQHVQSRQAGGARSDSLLGAVGFLF